MFEKLLDRLLDAETEEDVMNVLYGSEETDGVEEMAESGKITFADYGRLFRLGEVMRDSFRLRKVG